MPSMQGSNDFICQIMWSCTIGLAGCTDLSMSLKLMGLSHQAACMLKTRRTMQTTLLSSMCSHYPTMADMAGTDAICFALGKK